MSRSILALVALFVMAFFFQVEAAPVESRQIGGLQCNIARLQTVTNLAAASRAVNKIDTTTDPNVASAVSTAQQGISSAQAGIKTIAGALFTGQQAPAAARTQVGNGLTTAQTALQGISNTTGVSAALGSLGKTISAGQKVVADC